jgi:hypothetical protein
MTSPTISLGRFNDLFLFSASLCSETNMNRARKYFIYIVLGIDLQKWGLLNSDAILF